VDEHGDVPDRRLRIEQAILELRCWVAAAPQLPEVPLAFGLLNHDWFGHPLIQLLIVHPQHRQHGVGAALLHRLLSAAGWPERRVFATANQSNTSICSLLAASGFIESGNIQNLGPGGPERVYIRLAEPGGVTGAAD
jgi:GNAT superfamily N-acetyltransferase